MALKHRIKFPIGDWSDDGHGECDWFIINTNKTAEELREIHFLDTATFGFEIGEIANEYENNRVPDEVMEFLKANNFDLGEFNFYQGSEIFPTSLIKLWLRLLQFIDSTFEYNIEGEEILPKITFSGFDHKGRHLKNPGFGCFY